MAWQAMVIQAGLAKRDDLAMAGQVAERGPEITGRSVHVARMPADDREDIGKLFGELNCPLAAFEIGADADDFGDARCPGPGDDFWQFVGEIGVIEMGVGVVKCWHYSEKINAKARRGKGTIKVEGRGSSVEGREPEQAHAQEIFGRLRGIVGDDVRSL